MDDLVTFLRAALDDDERVALGCLPGPWLTGIQAGFEPSELADIGRVLYGRSNHVAHGAPLRPELDRWGQVANLEVAWKHKEHLAHIARHDPARVLRDVAAKRAIVAWCTEAIGDRDLTGYGSFGFLAAETMRHLAAVYADRPGYKSEWAPDPID